ncbi:ARF/SAR superfamily [Atractiella rhizophila]|nr:ARF/SAR superfamily [Atractiella rhizophila]
MGLLTIIRKNKRKEREMRILMLGLDNAGKTTIVKRINGEDIDTVSPTLGFNIKTLFHKGFSLNIWDVGGQRTLRPYWRNYFEATDAIIWVIDSGDRLRLLDCKNELQELLKEERLASASLLIFANKQDIPNAMSVEEIADSLELDAMDQSHAHHLLPCSAVTGMNLVEGLDWVVGEVGKRVYYSITSGSSIKGAMEQVQTTAVVAN